MLRSYYAYITLSFIILSLNLSNSFLLRTMISTQVARHSLAHHATTIQVPQRNHADSEGYPSPLHFIHIKKMLSDEEVSKCLELAVSYGSTKWDKPDAARHTNYATCDFAVEDSPLLERYLEEIKFQDRLWKLINEDFDIPRDHLFGFLDLFCVNYVATNDSLSSDSTMDRLEAHRDGSLISFSLLLSSPNEFEGGGTFFEALRDVEPEGVLYPEGIIRPDRAGDMVMHSGKLLHGADIVTKGQRTILVGFVDVAGPKPGVLAKASTHWGRLDVAEQRYRRQLSMTETGQNHYKRSAQSQRFLPKYSNLKQIVPVIGMASARAESQFQRESRLAAEDELLRSALITTKISEPEGGFNVPIPVSNGDYTIL
mmetsp:Transcript_151/g.211  ORF Transcript_151/g.211 Transcript_151/m.211 type:complete len:370 (+) Transcript_151:1-1110(+)